MVAAALMAPLAAMRPKKPAAKLSMKIPIVIDFSAIPRSEWRTEDVKAEWSKRDGVYYVRYDIVRGLTA